MMCFTTYSFKDKSIPLYSRAGRYALGWVGGCLTTYSIYDIVRMCVPKSPPFQHRQVYDNPPFFKKKVYERPYFLMLVYEWPKFSDTHLYAHVFRMKGYINSKDSI